MRSIAGTDIGGGGDAYVTVAAADTPAILKARADYVGTGTAALGGDEITIATALAAANTVLLMPGTFWVTHIAAQTYSILMASSKALLGSPGSIIKIRNSEDADLNVIYTSATTNVVTRGLRVNGNTANQGAGLQRGICFDDVGTDTTLGVVVDQCIVENFRHAGIYGAGTASYNIVISNNEAINCGNSYAAGCGIGLSLNTNARGATIVGNNITGCSIGIRLSYVLHSTISGNTIRKNGHEGMLLSYCSYLSITGNACSYNADYAEISIYHTSYSTVSGNSCQGNHYYGISLSYSDHNVVSANHCTESSQEVTNTHANIYITNDSNYNLICGNLCRHGALASAPAYGLHIANANCDANVVTDNDLYDSGLTANLLDAGTCTVVLDNNRGIEITQVRKLLRAKNTSGGALATGDVVVLKAVAAGNEITTTTAGGDKKVFGMAAEIIADTVSGLILTMGKTTALKVDGTDNIAIGDFLSTFTTAKIAKKAAVGDMAFAIALEAYATDDSAGVIDALLISPRPV